MPEEIIRNLTIQDTEELEKFYAQDNGYIVDHIIQYLIEFEEDAYSAKCICANGKILGIIDISEYDNNEREGNEFHEIIRDKICYIINGITVLKDYRNMSIGRKLIKKYIYILKKEINKSIILCADADPEAVGFYQQLGFKNVYENNRTSTFMYVDCDETNL